MLFFFFSRYSSSLQPSIHPTIFWLNSASDPTRTSYIASSLFSFHLFRFQANILPYTIWCYPSSPMPFRVFPYFHIFSLHSQHKRTSCPKQQTEESCTYVWDGWVVDRGIFSFSSLLSFSFFRIHFVFPHFSFPFNFTSFIFEKCW